MTMLADTRYSNRRRAVAAAFAGDRLDALVVDHGVHVRYLTGFTGSNGGVLLRKDLSATVATDGRYTTQIAEQVPDLQAITASACAPTLAATVEGPCRLGYEADFTSVSQRNALEEAVGEDVTLVPVTGLVEKVRLIKDEGELDELRAVAALATQALSELIEAGELAVGRTEIAIAADLEYRMRKLGAASTSFDTIVASGVNSSKPHHSASDKVIESGDLVTIDYGALLRGYNSDCTRTFIVGEPTDFAREIYDVVYRAQQAGVERAVAGTACKDVDAACREVIREAGYEQYFVHSTGHGIGLDVHEAPAAAAKSTGELAAGMTLTIEPGVYIPGKGGVRIEDTLIIRDGAAENITTYPKELTVIS
ncbi:M24 family metallopeptidase [Corynebacterium choanae]|uniref:Xaa-Pro dipeptidase n=1 Tax=Corynebacterium choanae TaxID=1862358 RepID=A0A3G6J718_9CORY|nr:aminopeptidase P family protein [Corynebacterium choanae]AZA13669.1 Xaa-Pro dipeptidase [Corynebacterium choanae]